MIRAAFYDPEGSPATLTAAITDAADWLDIAHTRLNISDQDRQRLDECRTALRQFCPTPRWFVFLVKGVPWPSSVYAAGERRRRAVGYRLSGNPNKLGKWESPKR